jgi:hypothetical protein
MFQTRGWETNSWTVPHSSRIASVTALWKPPAIEQWTPSNGM